MPVFTFPEFDMLITEMAAEPKPTAGFTVSQSSCVWASQKHSLAGGDLSEACAGDHREWGRNLRLYNATGWIDNKQ